MWRMGLKPEEYFEERGYRRRAHRQMKQVPTRRNHARQLTQTFVERHILQNPAGQNQIESFIGKRQSQNVALRESHRLTALLLVDVLPRGGH